MVTNREPYQHEKTDDGIVCRRSVGGVTSALDPLMQKKGGLWVAWGSGEADFSVTNSDGKVLVPEENLGYMLRRIWLSEKEVENYYRGFANRVLWPLCHLFVEKMHWREEYWETYQKINKKFADVVLEEIEKDDKHENMVWVHDYHLPLVPYYIKKVKPETKISYFWHIPWPPWEVFGSMPQREKILHGLLQNDLIGFHTMSYVGNFLNSSEKNPDIEVDKKNLVVKTDGNITKIKNFPLGISIKDYEGESKRDKIIEKSKEIRNRHSAEKLILGIDRLDYTKGILYRLKAFEKFLEKNPDKRNKATLVQIATPSRYEIEEYSTMKKEIDETVGRINARFRTEEWAPVKYYFRKIPQDSLLAYYQAADVALLTPIRDGMNLISKEFIASNDNNSMLILSEFAGASEELTEALRVNPYDIDATADAIKNAIEMPTEEKSMRCKKLKEKIKKHDSTWWVDTFLDSWEQLYDKKTISESTVNI